MKKKYIALLLVNTFLIGCGGSSRKNDVEQETSSTVEGQLSELELKQLTSTLSKNLIKLEQAIAIKKISFCLEKKVIDEVTHYARQQKDFTLQPSGVSADSKLLEWLSSGYFFKGDDNENVIVNFHDRSAVV